MSILPIGPANGGSTAARTPLPFLRGIALCAPLLIVILVAAGRPTGAAAVAVQPAPTPTAWVEISAPLPPTPTLVSRALPLLSNVEIVQRGQGWVEMSAPDPRAAASATAAGALLPPTGRATRASAVLPGPLVLL